MTPERFAKGMTFDEYATWASIPVAVFFTKDFVELYRYVEYPAIHLLSALHERLVTSARP